MSWFWKIDARIPYIPRRHTLVNNLFHLFIWLERTLQCSTSRGICPVISLTLSVLEPFIQGSEIRDQSPKHIYSVHSDKNSVNSCTSITSPSTLSQNCMYHSSPFCPDPERKGSPSQQLPWKRVFSVIRMPPTASVPQLIRRESS